MLIDAKEEDLKGKELPIQVTFFKPFIKSLPQSTADYPIFFKKDEIIELKGSHIVELIEELKEKIKIEYDLLSIQIPEFNCFTL